MNIVDKYKLKVPENVCIVINKFHSFADIFSFGFSVRIDPDSSKYTLPKELRDFWKNGEYPVENKLYIIVDSFNIYFGATITPLYVIQSIATNQIYAIHAKGVERLTIK